MRVILVGARKDYVDKFMPFIAKEGHEIIGYWGWRMAEAPEIPPECEGLMLSVDALTKYLSIQAYRKAVAKRIPVVVVQAKPYDNGPMLRAMGFAPCDPQAEHRVYRDIEVGAVLSFFTADRDKRDIKIYQEDLKDVCVRAFGTEHVVTPESWSKLPLPSRNPTSTSALVHAFLRGRPESTLADTLAHFGGHPESEITTLFEAEKATLDAMFRLSHFQRKEEDRKWAETAKAAWVDRFVQGYFEKNNEIPPWDAVNKESHRIFGTRPTHESVRAARARFQTKPQPTVGTSMAKPPLMPQKSWAFPAQVPQGPSAPRPIAKTPTAHSEAKVRPALPHKSPTWDYIDRCMILAETVVKTHAEHLNIVAPWIVSGALTAPSPEVLAALVEVQKPFAEIPLGSIMAFMMYLKQHQVPVSAAALSRTYSVTAGSGVAGNVVPNYAAALKYPLRKMLAPIVPWVDQHPEPTKAESTKAPPPAPVKTKDVEPIKAKEATPVKAKNVEPTTSNLIYSADDVKVLETMYLEQMETVLQKHAGDQEAWAQDRQTIQTQHNLQVDLLKKKIQAMESANLELEDKLTAPLMASKPVETKPPAEAKTNSAWDLLALLERGYTIEVSPPKSN